MNQTRLRACALDLRFFHVDGTSKQAKLVIWVAFNKVIAVHLTIMGGRN